MNTTWYKVHPTISYNKIRQHLNPISNTVVSYNTSFLNFYIIIATYKYVPYVGIIIGQLPIIISTSMT